MYSTEEMKTYRLELLKDVVEQIAHDPWQRAYRTKLVGKPIIGWTNRLWEFSLNSSSSTCMPQELISQTSWLYEAANLLDGRTTDQDKAIEVAKGILNWGGVTRGNLIKVPEVLSSVVRSAREGRQVDKAPMNSGWTKVAAFFAYKYPKAPVQVIYDSRVSCSICFRLVKAKENLEKLDQGWNSRVLQTIFPDFG